MTDASITAEPQNQPQNQPERRPARMERANGKPPRRNLADQQFRLLNKRWKSIPAAARPSLKVYARSEANLGDNISTYGELTIESAAAQWLTRKGVKF